jgi:DNA-directed RNA polymerase subunit K/omega
MDTEESIDPTEAPETPPEPRPKAPPIHNRFMFVDVAARRAKQLRRGATPRLHEDPDAGTSHRPDPLKAERVAMEEVRRGLVLYEVLPPEPVVE